MEPSHSCVGVTNAIVRAEALKHACERGGVTSDVADALPIVEQRACIVN